ncbi:hypothetical protein LPJ78_004898, partial [Coemansia sp. RSA 989]
KLKTIDSVDRVCYFKYNNSHYFAGSVSQISSLVECISEDDSYELIAVYEPIVQIEDPFNEEMPIGIIVDKATCVEEFVDDFYEIMKEYISDIQLGELKLFYNGCEVSLADSFCNYFSPEAPENTVIKSISSFNTVDYTICGYACEE